MALAQTIAGIAAGAYGPPKGELVPVLLISEARNGFSHLVKELEARGCQCRSVGSYDDALRLLTSAGFDLVVGVAPLPRGAISSLGSLLADRRASFFCAQPVEDGCWWVPIYRRGKRCFGAPALRASEFAELLDEIVEEVRRVPVAA